MPALKARARAIQTALHTAASLRPTTWAFRWKTPRSSASRAKMKALKRIQGRRVSILTDLLTGRGHTKRPAAYCCRSYLATVAPRTGPPLADVLATPGPNAQGGCY